MFRTLIKFFNETVLLIKKLPFAKYLFKDNEEDKGHFGSEVEVRTGRHKDIQRYRFFTEMFKPRESLHKFMQQMHVVHNGQALCGDEEEVWYFINGIMTDKRILRLNLHGLTEATGMPVTAIYNPTEGIYRDLLESVLGRATERIQDISHLTAAYMTKDIMCGKKVRIIGHSQGGIILSNVAKIFIQGKLNLDNVEFFTIAGAQDEFPVVPFAEHFANIKDYVCQIGVLHYEEDIYGTLYHRDATGHLLNAHYLEGIARGDYCNKQSRLYGYFRDSLDVDPAEELTGTS